MSGPEGSEFSDGDASASDSWPSGETGTADAARLIERLREFSRTLSESERALFAALLAPGVAQAYPEVATDEVSGFAMVDWAPSGLPAYLEAAVRGGGLRAEFRDP